METCEVLIVGAGPTGLVLALFLARSGVRSRIIDKGAGPGEQSRAMAVQARTLEFYRQLGFADEAIRHGIRVEAAHMVEGGREVATFELSNFGEGLSPYPFVLSFPQDEHERLLGEQLKAAGIDIQWETELVGFSNEGDRVRATLQNKGAGSVFDARYLCGCDGAHSVVRERLMLDFPGGTYEQMFFVADVEAPGSHDERSFSIHIDRAALTLVFPIRRAGAYRLIGLVPAELRGREDIGFEQIRPYVESQTGVRVEKTNWFSLYHVHHRVAEQFRVGRVFIAGDAGHIHSPAGGQGMNTGIGDAVNLAWKLAAVLQGRATASVLDTYEPERITFAHSLVASTDRLFQAIVGSDPGSQMFRSLVMPHLVPFALGFNALRRAAFRFVSQTRINYHESALSVGAVGEVQAGDRLPWVAEPDNFEPLKSLDWQLHVYGEANADLRGAAESVSIPLHQFAWSDAHEMAGFKRDALYLVRPDGYIGLADERQDVEKLCSYVAQFKITPRRTEQPA